MDLEMLDDRALVGRTQEGDRDAFAALVVRYQERVLNLVYRRLGDPERALDVTQEVFIKAYRGLPRFHGDAQFFTWLYRIAMNETISARRRSARHDRAVSLDARAGQDGRPLDPPDESFEPRAEAERQDDAAVLHRAIADLEDDLAQPLVLRDIDGRSYQEISEVLQIPLGSVKSRIHRARSALKERLAGVIERQ